MPNAAKSESPHVPVAQQVAGGPKLDRWRRAHNKSQLWLKNASGISQQLISAYINRLARPQPMSVNARRIERVTEGEVSVWDWMTPEECAQFRSEERLRAKSERR